MIIRSGQSLIELLVALGLSAILLPALLTGLVTSREGKAQQNQRVIASGLMKEADEALRVVREAGWVTFAVNGTFHPAPSGNTWGLLAGSEGPETLNGFTRSVEISDVYRDSAGKIVTTGGSLDPSSKKVVTSVSWSTPISYTMSATSYMTRYLDNLAWLQTTQSDFNAGTKVGTTVTNTLGGEVILGSGGQGDWCSPDLSITAHDLSRQGVANAITAIEGRVFAGTGSNASGPSFDNVSITNSNPPTASTLGSFDGFKTNDIFGESDHAYLATDTNNREIEIINISSPPYSESGYFDAPGPADANSVYVAGSVGYMVQGNVFRTFDLTSKSGSRPELGSVTLAGTGNRMVVLGTYAYIAVDNSSSQLQVIDVSSASSPTIVGQATVSGAGGVAVAVNSMGTRTYLATASSVSLAEFFIIDSSSKTGAQPVLGSYDSAGMDPRGVAVATANKVLLVGHDAEEYQALSVLNENNPTHCGGLNIDTNINGVSTVVESDGDAWSYIITGDPSSELKIIAGGPGGQFATSGTFTSSVFDAGYSTGFNYLSVTADIPANTSLEFQVAAADPVSGSCLGADFVFVGPDGTSSTFFDQSGGSIPTHDDGASYENPSRCFRYRAYFSTAEAAQTSVLYDVSINYSP